LGDGRDDPADARWEIDLELWPSPIRGDGGAWIAQLHDDLDDPSWTETDGWVF